jgi:thioredoxin 1
MFETLTDNSFNQFLQNNENVIAYFSATWCGPCKMQEPVLEQIANSFPNIRIGQIDVDRNPALSMAYGIKGTPTLLFFKQGKIVRFKAGSGRVDRLVGAQDFNRLQKLVAFLTKMRIAAKSKN